MRFAGAEGTAVRPDGEWTSREEPGAGRGGQWEGAADDARHGWKGPVGAARWHGTAARLRWGQISLTRIAPGSQCPNGGVAISTSSGGQEVVCNGGVTTAALPPGNPHCPNGGTRLDVTGASGTVSSQYLCNGSSGAQSASLDPPGGPAGSFTLVTRGGAGSAGAGGLGGDVRLRMAAGSLGGHVKVFRTGLTDASFIPPTVATSELGAVPLTVSSGTTVVAAKSTISCSGTPSGGAFTAADTPGPVFRCNGSGVAEQVSLVSTIAR